MSLESILSHIADEAAAQRERIIQEARLAADKILREAKAESASLYQGILEKEKASSLAKKQGLLVLSRLEQKKNLLWAKQELINEVLERLKLGIKSERLSRSGGIPQWAGKKQQVLADRVKETPQDLDFYLKDLRQSHETAIAKILFI